MRLSQQRKGMRIMVQKEELQEIVSDIVQRTPVTDVHTHLFAPHFSEFMLAGIDELLNYHYLIAETMRMSIISYETFWNLPKTEQANLIWETLFIKNTPYSEACRGVVTTLNKLGMNLAARDLPAYRNQLPDPYTSEYVDRVFHLSGVSSVVMTNDPFHSKEREIWINRGNDDPRFHAALRIDPLLNDYQSVYRDLIELGYEVDESLSGKTIHELQRFISEWMDRMNALYVAVSLPDSFTYPDDSIRTLLIKEVILPVCREKNRPFAMMIGVKRGINPDLRSAGDSVGKASIGSVENICSAFPGNKFLVTMLSRENQHELTVTARKFRNLMVFGCWWFLNNPSLIDEITSLRFELLGSGVIPQHSDARVLDQLIYKWAHSRQALTGVLTKKYADLIDAGWNLEEQEIERDIKKLFNDRFWNFIELALP